MCCSVITFFFFEYFVHVGAENSPSTNKNTSLHGLGLKTIERKLGRKESVVQPCLPVRIIMVSFIISSSIKETEI